MKNDVAVLIPAFNAASTLPGVVSRIPERFRANVVVVDDGSTDATAEVARALSVDLVRHPANRGYGAAQASLYRRALDLEVDVMVMMHSDGGHRPEELPDVVDPILRGEVEIVIGSRILGILEGAPARVRSLRALKRGHRSPMPDHIFVANLCLTAVQNLCYRSNFASFHDGFRAVTADVVRGLSFDALTTGYLYDTEFLVAARDHGYGIAQVPVSTHYEPASSAWRRNLRYGLAVLGHALSYRFTNSTRARRAPRPPRSSRRSG